jgi:hypothetical protein
MQLLKGLKGKSVTVHHLLNSTHSICIVYDTGWTPSFECYFVDSKEATIKQLKNWIESYIKEIEKATISNDYFIIYTNNSETELKELAYWLDDNKDKLKTVEILVTCRF